MKTNHLLIIRLSAMGDVAMTVPIVAAVARQYPHLRITVLSRPFARAFYEDLAPNVGFMEANADELRNLHGLNGLYRRLVAKKFTAVADLHDVLRTKYLRLRFCLGGFRVAHIDKHRHGKRLLTRNRGKVLVQQPTSFQNYADVMARLGYPIDSHFRSIYEGKEAPTLQSTTNIGSKAKDERWIGIAPFAAHQGKVYPIHLMRQVIDGLSQAHPTYRLFLFGGGKAERLQLDAIAEANNHCTIVAGCVKGLQEELVLMSQLDVMLSMDSANMHLASLVATPVVSVWGATHPYAGFMGWGQQPQNAIQTPLPCRPCSIYGNRPCLRGDYACLTQIAPQDIISRIEEIIK